MHKLNASLSKLVQAAFANVVEKVIRRSEQTGTPIIVWEGGKIKELTPQEARRRQGAARAKAKRMSKRADAPREGRRRRSG